MSNISGSRGVVAGGKGSVEAFPNHDDDAEDRSAGPTGLVLPSKGASEKQGKRHDVGQSAEQDVGDAPSPA